MSTNILNADTGNADYVLDGKAIKNGVTGVTEYIIDGDIGGLNVVEIEGHTTTGGTVECEVYNPQGGNYYVVSDPVDVLLLSGTISAQTTEWACRFTLNASGSVVFILAQGSYEYFAPFTFEGGKTYIVSCDLGVLVAKDVSTVVV